MKILDMTEEQRELQNQCGEIRHNIDLIQKTIKVLNEVKEAPVVIRNELSKDINKLIKTIQI